MKKFILFFSLFTSVLGVDVNAQNMDSLHKVLKNTPNTISKVKLLNKIAYLYWSREFKNSMDSIELFSSQAVKLARVLNDKKDLAYALNTIGRYHISLTKKIAVATPFLLESLSLYEELNDRNGISGNYLQLGLVSYILQYNEDAIRNYKLSLKYADTDTDIVRYLLALSYSELDSVTQSKKYFSSALESFSKNNQFERQSECYMYLGKLYAQTNDMDSAFFYLNLSIDSIKSQKRFSYLTRPYAFISGIYLKNKEIEKAILYGEKSLAINTTESDDFGYIEAIKTLHAAYSLQGNYSKAYYYLNLLNSKQDFIFNGSTKQKVAEMQNTFDYKKKINDQKISRIKDKEIAEEQIQKEKILRNSILSGAVLLLLLLGVVYNRFAIKRKANIELEEKNKIISKEKVRSDNLLLNILPAEVAEELKEKGSSEAKMYDEVTVLFADFKGFTQFSEQLTATDLVQEINECFIAFDHIMRKHGVEKIKTIGDAYMAAGGLPTPNSTHCFDVVNAAMEIQKFMAEHKKNKSAANKMYFEARIGVHTGPVVAGIVGVDKFAYDIWGDTVNTASRMESSGEVGEVNISGITFDRIKDFYVCEYRGKVQAKGKGEVDMYFVKQGL
jgi:adenylate cyclase